jgi:hypothetical protein
VAAIPYIVESSQSARVLDVARQVAIARTIAKWYGARPGYIDRGYGTNKDGKSFEPRVIIRPQVAKGHIAARLQSDALPRVARRSVTFCMRVDGY